MNHKITEIEILLDKINLLFSGIKSDGQIDQIEAGLFLKYLKQLQEKIDAGANNLNSIVKEEPKDTAFVKEEIKKAGPEINDIKPFENKPEIKTVENKQEIKPVEIKEEKKSPEINIKAFEELQKQKEIPLNESPVTEKTKNKKAAIIIPEEDEDLQTGLNQKLLKDKKTLADKINIKKASDLRTMIDLNDRIYFIRELFKGDSHAFDKAIKYINQLNSLSEANQYIEQELKRLFNWKSDEAAGRFSEVVGNKFS